MFVYRKISFANAQIFAYVCVFCVPTLPIECHANRRQHLRHCTFYCLFATKSFDLEGRVVGVVVRANRHYTVNKSAGHSLKLANTHPKCYLQGCFPADCHVSNKKRCFLAILAKGARGVRRKNSGSAEDTFSFTVAMALV